MKSFSSFTCGIHGRRGSWTLASHFEQHLDARRIGNRCTVALKPVSSCPGNSTRSAETRGATQDHDDDGIAAERDRKALHHRVIEANLGFAGRIPFFPGLINA